MQMKPFQMALIRNQLRHALSSPFYAAKFIRAGIDVNDLHTQKDFEKLPFSDKAELRNVYPLGLQAVPQRDIVRVHSSSGTTGQAVIIPYTRRDIDDWSVMMCRCFELCKLTDEDRIQITPGYGLWTAGIGFQAGCERLGAMSIPTGPGNTERQLQMMLDLRTTALCATSSYALILAEAAEERNLRDKLSLRCGIIGSERWSDSMRCRIEKGLGIELFDIYGLTECYGPGISNECSRHEGLHYFDDYLYFEIIDPDTGLTLPNGEFGELVITTLRKEGAPLIRYRTHDITRILPQPCTCGSPFPRHDRIIGRTDDMIKIKATSMYPAQIDTLLSGVAGTGSEYKVVLDRENGRDQMTVQVECLVDADRAVITRNIQNEFKNRFGIKIEVKPFCVGELGRSEGKTRRVVDNRIL
jgi:phenylacetate-CoA ligase